MDDVVAVPAAEIPTWWGVVASFALVALAALVSWRVRLGLTRELVWVALRALV